MQLDEIVAPGMARSGQREEMDGGKICVRLSDHGSYYAAADALTVNMR